MFEVRGVSSSQNKGNFLMSEMVLTCISVNLMKIGQTIRAAIVRNAGTLVGKRFPPKRMEDPTVRCLTRRRRPTRPICRRPGPVLRSRTM